MSGYITKIDALKIGRTSVCWLRKEKVSDKIDYTME
jgi:hypothetical protein